VAVAPCRGRGNCKIQKGKPKPFSLKRATESEIGLKLRDVVIVMFTFVA